MKKVVLMTGVLAAGLAAAPVTANAAAPSSPNVQEVNEVTPKDADDVYGSYVGQIKGRFDDIADLKNRINKALSPFTSAELSYKNTKKEEIPGWHDKAKQEALEDLTAFDHELHDMEEVLEKLWKKYNDAMVLAGTDVDEQTKAINAFIDATKTEQTTKHGDKVILANIISRDYAQNVLPVKYQHLNQDWRIYTEYQKLGSDKWAEYYAFTSTQAYKEVNETYDVDKEVLVEEKSNTFRLFYEGKHANRLQDDREFCKNDCCLDNLAKIEELYQAFCTEFEKEKTLVAKYHSDRKALLEGKTGLDAAYNNFLDKVKIDPTTIVSNNGNPDKDSDKATEALNNKKAEIEAAQTAARDFIQTFNAKNLLDAPMKNADWEAANWVGEGKNIVPGKVLNNKNYNEEATRLIGVVTKLVGEYSALVEAAKKNRDNYDAVVADIKGTDDWNAKGKEHDADALDKHSKAPYYQSAAFDTEVPAARTAALYEAELAYEAFKLKTVAEVTTFKTNNTEALDTAYEDYKDKVARANANEEAHDAQHKVLDPLAEKFEALKAQYEELTNLAGTNDDLYHENISAEDVNELYPENGDHGYSRYMKQAIENVKDELVLAQAAYNKAYSDIEKFYNDGKSATYYVNKEVVGALKNDFDDLNTKNGKLGKAIEAAIDNEVAFLEGAHAYDAALAQAHHDLDEYKHHPETFGHWDTEIDAVLAKFPPVLDELIKKYDEEADARNYVKNVLPGVLQGLAKDVADLEKAIKDNQTARDANEAAINAALTDLAALKAKYDTTKFTLEDKVTTGEATALKADFQNAWKSYVENDLDVPALFEAPNTESDLHFAQTAEGVDFDADIQAMLSAIKSENSIDFDIHHQATDDYALNLAAVKYLKDVVIPALDKKFDELVQANEDAHKAQYEAYAALEKGYDCYNTTGLKAAVNGIANPDYALNADDHGTADATVATALKTYKDQIDNSYIAGSAKADQANIDGKKKDYVDALNHAKTNDATFMTEYGKYTTELAKVQSDVKNWRNNYYDDKGNKCSNTANTNVTNAYNAMVKAANDYLANIKTDWYNNLAKENIADNAGLLKKYRDAVTAYNKAVDDAKANDTEFGNELKALGELITLTAYNGEVDKANADANLKKLLKYLENLEPECNAAKYNAVLADMVSDWEKEDLIKAAVARSNNTAISNYKANAAKYNALMAEVNKCATYQAALTAAKGQIEKLPVVKDKLAIDGVDKKWDKDRDALINDKTGLQWIQNAIENLEMGIDIAYFYGHNYPTNAQIATDIENLKKKATEENDKYVENENAFEPLHDNINNVIAYAEDTTSLVDPAKEAFEKAVAGYVKTLGELVDQLEKAYLNEEAAKVKAEIETKFADLKKKIEHSKKLAEQIGKNLGDVNKDGEVDEWDSTGSNPDGIVEIVLYDRAYNKYGDMDLNGANDITDINLLNNLLWHQSVYGKKAGAADVEFEGSVDLMVAGNTVALALNNNVAVNGIQFDVTVPAGAKFSSVIGTARTEGLNVLSAKIAEDTYRVLVVSLGASKVINGNDGNLVSFNVSGEGEVEVYNVIATDGVSHNLNGAAVSLGQTTGIDEIASEGNTEIFGLDGIRQNVMKAGVNIVRGANGVVKKIFK